MAFMSILLVSGIFLVIWMSVATVIGIAGLIFFLWGLIQYYRIPLGRNKTLQYIKLTIGIVLLIISLFGLCILFPLKIFATCLTALAGVVVLCFSVPKRVLFPAVNHRALTIAIVSGIILVAGAATYMAVSGIATVVSVIKTVAVT